MNKRNNTICVAAALVALASLSCVKKISDEHSEVQSPIILEKPQDPPFQDQLAADLRAYLSGSTESSITKPILINPNQRAFPIKVTATKNDDPCLRDFALQVYNSMISTKEDVVINGERIIIMGADPEQFSLVENMDDQPISTNIASIGTSPYVLSIRISVLNGDISSTLYIVPLVESTCKQNRPGPCFESIEGATVVQRNPFHSIKRYDDVCRKPDTRVSQVPDSKKIADCDHSTSSKESCMSQRTNQYTDCLRQFSSHKDIIKIASEAAKDPGALNVDKIQRKVDASHINSAEKKVLSERCLTPLELRRRKITILTALTANIGGDGTIQRFHAGGGLYFGLGLPVKRTQRLVIRPGLNYRANQYTEAYLAPGDLNMVLESKKFVSHAIVPEVRFEMRFSIKPYFRFLIGTGAKIGYAIGRIAPQRAYNGLVAEFPISTRYQFVLDNGAAVSLEAAAALEFAPSSVHKYVGIGFDSVQKKGTCSP